MKYELAKELKDSGFPLEYSYGHEFEDKWINASWRAVCKHCGYTDPIYQKVESGGATHICAIGAIGCIQEMFTFVEPTLSELIEACMKTEPKFFYIIQSEPLIGNKHWVVYTDKAQTKYPLLEEAVARLWLVLNKK